MKTTLLSVATALLVGAAAVPGVNAQLRENTFPREYVVKRGDTLYRIALNHGTSVAAIQQINALAGTKIEVGQVLLLDAENASEVAAPDAAEAAPAKPVSAEPTEEEAEVEAASTGTESVGAAAEGEPPLFVEAFDENTDGASAAVAAPEVEIAIDPVSATNAFDVARARNGENFVTIATRLSVAPGLLRVLNPDVTAPFTDETVIRLPIEPSTVLYRVKDGDTLDNIAAVFGSTPARLASQNGITDNALRIGQVIRIPVAVAAAGSTTANESSAGDEPVSDLPVVTDSGDVAGEQANGGTVLTEEPTGDPDVSDVVVTGRANVYPDQFAGRLMAIGKPYDPKRFTISHATLDLGTVVLLTNEATGRKTFAEVTDRPPAGAGYLADVSRAVAEVLGLEANGGEVRFQVAR